MRFSLATTILAAASTAQALALPQIQPEAEIRSIDTLLTASKVESIETSTTIEKREIITTILSAATSGGVSAAAKAAIDAAIELIQNLTNWTNARETFTRTTAYTMLVNNPDTATYVGTVCYNQDYTLLNDMHSEITSVELALGVLTTDYDCFYMQAGNTFYPQGEGGYINVASYWYTGKCTSDSATGNLVC